MAFFTDPAAGVLHSISPSTLDASSQSSETPAKEPSEVEKLALELRRMNENHANYRSDADRRIGELVQQNNLLRQTYEAELAKAAGTRTQGQAQNGGTEINDLWNNLLGTPAAGNGQTGQQTAQSNNRALTPEEVQRITLETLQKSSAVNHQLAANAAELEAALVDKFKRECPDLHKHAREVVTLWKQFAATEPDPIRRYNKVINTTRELYGSNRGVGVGGPDESRPNAPAPSNGQSRKGGANTIEAQMQAEIEAEKARHAMTEQIVRDRKRQFQTRTGYPYDALNSANKA